jgi:hypothetical protein
MNADSVRQPRLANSWLWVIWLAGAAALVYLVIEHRPHLFGWIPYLILLACPLMHLFMHRRRGHHHDGH